MAERSWCTESWTDSQWFQGLNPNQRYLFIYLCTNEHCKQAGLFYITLPTIAFETKISEVELPNLLKALEPRVLWYKDKNLMWVKNFIKRQYKSPKFLVGVANCLNKIKNKDKDIVKELIEYNYTTHSILIPYDNGTGSIDIAPLSLTPNTDNKPKTNSKDAGDGVRQVWGGLGKRRSYPSPNTGKESQAIKWMLTQGYTPAQILSVYDLMKKDQFWARQHLDMQSVKKQIGAKLGDGTHRQDASQTGKIKASITKPLR